MITNELLKFIKMNVSLGSKSENGYIKVKERHKASLLSFKKHEGFLASACIQGDLDTVIKLIKYGVDFHFNHETPLLYACYHGHYDIVRYLISKGASVAESDALMTCRDMKMLAICAGLERSKY
jgi:ankyrin repeat protein